MNALIIGGGGREYAIARALRADKKCNQIYFASGNGASEKLGVNITAESFEALADFAANNDIELTIVGGEEPLTKGIVDIFRARNLAIFGPTKAAARLEGSKAFMKNFLKRNRIQTAKYIETDDLAEAKRFIAELTPPIVVKADGLCAGKGVIIAQSQEEAASAAGDMLSGASFAEAGRRVVIEEFLDGFELSVFAISDGKDFVTLPVCQDHKRLLTGDLGPNTGGMGAYAPAPLADETLIAKIKTRIVRPTIDAMAAEGSPFTGVLFCGIMVVGGEPYTLEFNARFGDPECEALMALLETSAIDLFYNAAIGKLSEVKPRFSAKSAVGVVVASQNYPYGQSRSAPITIESGAENENAHILFAAVTKGENGELLASGGRVLVAMGLGENIRLARERAYDLIAKIKFDGMQYRTDIAYQALR
ncbi:MAG: phosphoribosylamine--glycine ligase [Helicobacteraceae bacterium]|jgi:phosphoribosylamine--glycine ligase|nr:phosphoribosylamine--glycine ligase [Helicobacteraceae bacterium]